jgi:hypothetical protein
VSKMYEISRSQTHCDNKHEFTPANTCIVFDAGKPHWLCRMCERDEAREIERKAREKQKKLRKPFSPINLEWKGRFGHINDVYVPTLDEIREATAAYTYDILRQITRGENLHVIGYQEPESDDNVFGGHHRKMDKEKIQRELAGGHTEIEDLSKEMRRELTREKEAWWREKKKRTIIRKLSKRSWNKPDGRRTSRIKYVTLAEWQYESIV